MLFKPGQIVATRNVLSFAEEHKIDLMKLLARHLKGDWGDVDVEDQNTNAMAVYSQRRILSSYHVLDGADKVWIVTEYDRSSTTIMKPEDY